MPRPGRPARLAGAVDELGSERELAGLALELGAGEVGAWSPAEQRLLKRALAPEHALVARTQRDIAGGRDPLGAFLCALRSPEERRPFGATYTPLPAVEWMAHWAARHTPARIVDPGAGSARFLVAAGRRVPRAELVAAELDPLACLLARAHLAAAGLAQRARLLSGDFTTQRLPEVSGRTLFIGNPPYVRHHGLRAAQKARFRRHARELGLEVSALAGLHAHFLVAIARAARPGDYGVLLLPGEWLTVKYGAALRQLFVERLGVLELHVFEPRALPFADAHATGVIVCFEVATKRPTLKLRELASLAELDARARSRTMPRGALLRGNPLGPPARERARPAGYVELGELCGVHRGQVTGANAVWIAGEHSRELPPSLLFSAITRAAEIIRSGDRLVSKDGLRCVIDIPAALDGLPADERGAVERFLERARAMGAASGYIARHRRAWWSVGLYPPAPVVATYMARRAPAFTYNQAGVRHLNIAHGLYPREPLAEASLARLTAFLNRGASRELGRTYAGGLTKFEPSEMARLCVPGPELLADPEFEPSPS